MMRSLLHSLLLLGLAAVVACGPNQTGGGIDAPPSPVASITVTPADQILEIDGTEPATSAFVATALYEDGRSEDVSDRAQFRLSNGLVGTFMGNTFKST